METIGLKRALDIMKSRYSKVILANFTTNIFEPYLIREDEWQLIKDKENFGINEYLDWFVDSGFIYKEDANNFKKFVQSPTNFSYILYRRIINGETDWVIMEMTRSENFSEENKEMLITVRSINNIYSEEYRSVVSRLGITDSMTGLYNKFCLENDLKEFSGYYPVIFADLNCLKKVNDTLGHKAGDELIKEFSELLKTYFSSDNYKVYHISGDEFVVVMNKPDLIKFIRDVRNFKVANDSGEHPMASIGYDIGEAKGALALAEKFMYIEKKHFYKCYPQLNREA